MKTRCPFCDRKYDLGKTPLGGKVKCFGCNNSFLLPTSMSILRKDDHPTEDMSRPRAAAAAAHAAAPEESPSFSKIIAGYFSIGSLVLPFLLAVAAVVCTIYKMPFQIGIILVLAAGVIIFIPILMNLREINRKLKK